MQLWRGIYFDLKGSKSKQKIYEILDSKYVEKTFLAFNFFVFCQNLLVDYIYPPSMGRISKLSTTVLRARINVYKINNSIILYGPK